MPSATSTLAEKLSNFIEAAWFELPLEASKLLLGAADQTELRKAGWKVYDAWVGLANELTNALYADPLIAETSGRMMEAALRFRQMNGLMSAAFFGNVWPLVGLPTHREMVALREDLLSLREELAAYAARLLAIEEIGAADGQDIDDRQDAAGYTSRPLLNGYAVSNRKSSANGCARRNIVAG